MMSDKNETDKMEKEKIIIQTAEDYSKYFKVDTSQERNNLDKELEIMLTKLEEYGSLLDRTRGESRHTLESLVPQMYCHYQALQQSFQSIDNLEALVTHVKGDLEKLESNVAQAESDLGANQGFTSRMKPLFFLRDSHSAEPSTTQNVHYSPPEIFSAEDFFIQEATPTSSKSTNN
ncbi:unnamed protein product [Meganyctiphanes norvegica]|uniref:Biogenesis of lysosome-related organelles complex 1 subunit 4 n=1 Tax=Meganyctiphanes norvegica TaxID=48144 RepID=A0AAV2RLE5_MEGNR